MLLDRSVFDVETFVPSDLVHRDGPLDALSASLDPVVRHGSGRQTHLFGPSGAGKTCLARYSLQQLREEAPHVRRQYINCWEHYATAALLYQLADGVGAAADVRPDAVPHDELLRRLRDADDYAYVVVLDEVDQIEEPQVLYQLYRMPHVHTISIANDEHAFFNRLDERLTSRLRSGEVITLDRYSREELVSILARRAEAGLEPGATTQPILEAIAQRASGDARVAVETLFQAARKARARGSGTIAQCDIEAAEPVARSELRQKTLSQLTRHQRLLYEALCECAGPTGMAALEARYQERAEQPKSTKTLRRYLKKLAQYNLVEIAGEKSGRRYLAR